MKNSKKELFDKKGEMVLLMYISRCTKRDIKNLNEKEQIAL